MRSILTFCILFTVVFADDCVISNFDDAENAAKTCSNLVIKDMEVPAGQTLQLDLQDGATLTFDGTITFGFKNWDGYLFKIIGNGITVNGAPGSVIDGQGALYWDGEGANGSPKPKLFNIQATGGSVFNNIQIKNCPKHCVTIKDSDHLTLDGWNIDVSDGDENALGHNTDGFDISQSNYVVIQNSNVFNQDDCIAVNQGSHMTFYKMYCSGSHGLSLSVGMSANDGDENIVADITFLNSTVVNADNAIHIKTHTDGGKGAIKNVIYRNIQFSGIRNYGINIQEDYANGGSTGILNNNIPITNLIFDNVQGTVESSATGVYIFCADEGCSDWHWTDVSVSGQKENSCNFTPNGFNC